MFYNLFIIIIVIYGYLLHLWTFMQLLDSQNGYTITTFTIWVFNYKVCQLFIKIDNYYAQGIEL